MKVKVKDMRYGCFNLFAVCGECGKANMMLELSFNRDGISMSDGPGCRKILVEKLKNKEHFYCLKCGADMKIDTAE